MRVRVSGVKKHAPGSESLSAQKSGFGVGEGSALSQRGVVWVQGGGGELTLQGRETATPGGLPQWRQHEGGEGPQTGCEARHARRSRADPEGGVRRALRPARKHHNLCIIICPRKEFLVSAGIGNQLHNMKYKMQVGKTFDRL